MDHYDCIVDLKNKQLITNFKTIPLFKVTDNCDKDKIIAINETNEISLEPRIEKVVKLKSKLRNTEAILLACEIENVRLPNSVVKIDGNGKFLTTAINANAIPKTVSLPELSFEPFEMTTINSLGISENPGKYERPEIRKQLRLDHLNEEEQELITKLCLEYSDIFYLEGDNLSFTNEIKHQINTKDNKPIYTKSYRYPHVHKEEVKNQISKMLDQKIIQPSTSPWSAPVWVVPKKMDASGKPKWRVVIDYRKLNEITVDDKYPLPNISDLLDQLGKCQYFTTLDLASGFHQIEIDPQDVPKTAFTVENGHYEFVRMPFGLKNAPSTFQRVMDNILMGIQNERCLVYMDDIIVYSPSVHEHVSRLSEVFKRLRKAHLKIQPDKCEFLRKEVAYLGHVITPEGVKPNPSKVECIKNFPMPKNAKEIKSFLGLCGYYRRFIANFAKISKPLTRLLQKNIEFKFDEECRKAFEILKEALMTSPILIYPNFEEPFILTTDASAFAIGGVLSQGHIGKDLPIAYASRTLCKAEAKYSTIERELLAIIWAVKHFRPYLFGRKFKLVTDHRPLTWLFSITDPGSRLARWRLKLEEYDYEIIFKPGKTNKNADALSRIKINYFEECAKLQARILHNSEDETSTTGEDQLKDENLPGPSTSTVQVKEETEEREIGKIHEEFNTFAKLYQTKSIIDYSKIGFINGQLLDKSNKNIVTFFWQNKLEDLHYSIIEDILEENPKFEKTLVNIFSSKSVKDRKYHIVALPYDLELVIEYLFYIIFKNQNDFDTEKIYYIENNLELPILEIFSFIFAEKLMKFKVCQNLIRKPSEDEIPIIIEQYHTGKAHLHRGVNETVRRIKENYNWTGLIKDVEQFIKNCEICQKVKICRKNLSSPFVVTETPKAPFERINVDIFEAPTKNYALTIRDELTKFTQAYALSDKTAKTVVTTLLLYFQHYGTPLRIHCDYGREFDNNLMKDLCSMYDIKLTFSSVNHPQSNGSLERFHATLAEMIRVHLAENPGEHPFNILPYAVICYNNTKNKTHGFTPYELLFGHTASKVPERMYKEKELMTKYMRDLNNRISYYYKIARERTQETKEKSKIRFDQNISKQQPQYKPGDKVYVRESQIKDKLQNKFNGPFEILEVYNNSAMLVNWKTRQKTKVNFDRLKPYFEN